MNTAWHNAHRLSVSTMITLPLRLGLCHTIGTLPAGASALACSIADHNDSRSVRLASTWIGTPGSTTSGESGPPWY
jgi:hypothetical protein